MRAPVATDNRFRTGGRPQPRTRSRPGRGRVVAWVLVRVTGLLLTVLVLGHFALTHIINDVAETDAAFVARRWGSAVWLTWDWLMLAAAISHGATGIWVAIEDYTPDPLRRRRRQRGLIAISLVLFVAGTISIVAATLTWPG